MNTKVWYLPYFEGVHYTRVIETYSNVKARMVCMFHTMFSTIHPLTTIVKFGYNL